VRYCRKAKSARHACRADFGQPALWLSRVPIIGDAMIALVGGLMMDFKIFSLWTAAGKLLR